MKTVELSNTEIRKLAAEKIQKQGLARQKYECPDTGALCMLGAVRKVIFGKTEVWNILDRQPSDPRVQKYWAVVRELDAALPADHRPGESSTIRIGTFNDFNDKATVIQTLVGSVGTQDV